MSHTKYEIDRAIRIPQNEPNENTTWATITSKPKKKSPVRREYGEPPLPMVCVISNYFNTNFLFFNIIYTVYCIFVHSGI